MLYGCYFQSYRPRGPVLALVATRSPTDYLVRTLCVGCFGARELATSDWLSPWKLSHSIGFLSGLAVCRRQSSRKVDSIFKFVKD